MFARNKPALNEPAAVGNGEPGFDYNKMVFCFILYNFHVLVC